MDGLKVQHAFTHAGEYQVQVTGTGLGAITERKSAAVSVSGDVSTRFRPADKHRAE